MDMRKALRIANFFLKWCPLLSSGPSLSVQNATERKWGRPDGSVTFLQLCTPRTSPAPVHARSVILVRPAFRRRHVCFRLTSHNKLRLRYCVLHSSEVGPSRSDGDRVSLPSTADQHFPAGPQVRAQRSGRDQQIVIVGTLDKRCG